MTKPESIKALARMRKRTAAGKCRACQNKKVYSYYCEDCMAKHRDLCRVRMRRKRALMKRAKQV